MPAMADLQIRLQAKLAELAKLEVQVVTVKAEAAELKRQLRQKVQAAAAAESSSSDSSEDEREPATPALCDHPAPAVEAVGVQATPLALCETPKPVVPAAAPMNARGRPRRVPLGECSRCFYVEKGEMGGRHTYTAPCKKARVE
jgi:hypothetical protein